MARILLRKRADGSSSYTAQIRGRTYRYRHPDSDERATYTGGTNVAAGTLQVDGSLVGATTVASGARLSGIGMVGSVTTLTGAVVRAGSATTPFGTLALTGNYTGSGTVAISAQLA